MKARSVANKIVKEIIPISISTGYVQLMSTNAESWLITSGSDSVE